jgi:hypothetical protein
MIIHHYRFAGDNPAQSAADLLDRQEVGVDWYAEHMTDAPLFRWIDGQEECGMDPWRFYMDLPIEPEDAKKRGWRIFVQKRDLPPHMGDPLKALTRAEAFVSGFEGDELQDGVDSLLNDLRVAIARTRKGT